MSRWFRLYDEILDDPKVQMLSAGDFKQWINLLCLASRNDGRLPALARIAFALRETQDAVSTLLDRLLSAGLIERRSGGADGGHYAPNKWNERQYKSDTSTGRVKRFRERSKDNAETPKATPPETDTDNRVPLANANGVDPETVLFNQGLEYLKATGISEKRGRPWLGKLKRDYDTVDVISALGRAKREGVFDVIPWVEAALQSKAKTYDPERITV